MSRRANALYRDEVQADGRVLIYEGHDDRKVLGMADPRTRDQPLQNLDGTPTDNGKFFAAIESARRGGAPVLARVYEKLRTSVWVFKGDFQMVDAWQDEAGGRRVCKYRLVLVSDDAASASHELESSRIIPGDVMAEVWKRDGGKCTRCSAADNLHFDHILPYSKGGTSLLAANIQLLCAKHNLSKGARLNA